MSFVRRYQLAIGFGLALVVVAGIVLISMRSSAQADRAARDVAHTHEVISTLEQILAQVEAAETAQRAYVITGIEDFIGESNAARPRIAAALATLARLISDNPSQAARLRRLRARVDEKLTIVGLQLRTRKAQGFEAARALAVSGAGKNAMDRVRELVEEMEAHENSLLAHRRARSAAQRRRAQTLLVAGALSDAALLALVFYAFVRDQRLGRELARAMKETRDAAVRSAELRSQFLANMSHEIRTPMNAIIGLSGVMLDTKLDADQRELTQTIRTSADALLTVINDVLDFSKLEAGKLAIEAADFELRPAVESVLDLFSDAASKRSLALGVLVDHELPRTIRGDAGRIRQVLTNLLGNALKFTAAGEVVVSVDRVHPVSSRAETRDPLPSARSGGASTALGMTPDMIRFSVRDTGIGIAPDVVPRLFQPFSQADATTTRRFGGTGLGLVISKQIVESMGGAMGVESQPDRGSTFWFEIPLVTAAAEEPREVSLSSLQHVRVLVIDDNATNLRIIKHNLAAWHMAADAAETANGALAKMREAANAGKPYDLVISDYDLPDMNGLVLSRLIKCDRAIGGAHIIILTSMANRIELPIMRVVGIDDCLSRPVKQSTLFDAIVNAVSGIPARVNEPERRERRPMRTDVRVLVAEDNPVNQKVAVRQLERLGFSADAAANGIEAVEAVSRHDYALVLMDVQMPEMDGFAATREIRRREPPDHRVPIVALTANALAGDRERCLEAGMDDYLQKPFAESDLLRVLQTYVSRAPGPPLDEQVLSNLRDAGGGDEGFIRELVALYLEDAHLRLAHLREAVQEGDGAQLANAAHALKSSSGNIGAAVVRDLCGDLEVLGRSGTLANAAAKLQQLEREYARVEDELRRLIAA